MSLDEAVNLKKLHYLIIDDSEMIRSQLSRSLATICQQSGYQYQLFQVGRNGQLSQQTLNEPVPNANPARPDLLYCAYTAASYKLGLRVLDLPDLPELTILCDLSIPSDTEVGLLGFLEGLTRRRIAVNLMFMSSDYQNRAAIEPLLKKGKAFFIEKGTPQWNNLPKALVYRATNFNYQRLSPDDYSGRVRPTSAPPFIEQLAHATINSQLQQSFSQEINQVRSRTTGNLELPKEEPANPRAGTTGALNAEAAATPKQPEAARPATTGALTPRPAPAAKTDNAAVAASQSKEAEKPRPAVSRESSTGSLRNEKLRAAVARKAQEQAEAHEEHPVQAEPEAAAQGDQANRPNFMGKFVNSVKDLPGKAGAIGSSGTARLREIPDLIKKTPLPHVQLPARRKKEGGSPSKS